MPLLVIVAIIVGILVMENRKPTADFDAIFKKYGATYGVDWRLLKAVAMHETGLNATAVNASDPSFGLMQVLCRYDGEGVCQNAFNVEGWHVATKEKLLNPDYNVSIASQVLAWNIERFGFPKGIAVYNSWDQRTAPVSGPFKNQGYVDDVLAKFNDLKAVA